jgi:hypothetical protein
MIAPAGCVLLLAAIGLATALSARATVAQDRQGIERGYQDLVRSVVRIEARYASIFEPPGAAARFSRRSPRVPPAGGSS